MAEVLLFHHVLGRTSGMADLAERFRSGGHTVHLPDLFEGRVFTDREEGRAYVDGVGFDTIAERGRVVAEQLPRELVYAGVSLGVLPAQQLTQTRLGATGAFFVSAAIEPSEFGAPWPNGVPVQIHAEEDDPLLAEGDLDAARSIVEVVAQAGTPAELVLYPGSAHLFMDCSAADYDAAATDLLVARAQEFFAGL